MRLAYNKIFDKEKTPKDFLEKFFSRQLEILTKPERPRVFIFMRYANNKDLLDFSRKIVLFQSNEKKTYSNLPKFN